MDTLRKYFFILGLVWTLLIGGSLYLTLQNQKAALLQSALAEARGNFNKDQAIRNWVAKKGGIYVPVKSGTSANPYLSHVKYRDIVRTDGTELTLMNPAYMLKELHQQYSYLSGTIEHITSLKPLRPENKADEWESQSLRRFEKGIKETVEVSSVEGTPYMRLMRPMLTKEQCMLCHAHQGYQVGDIRGGVSVSVNLTPYLELHQANSNPVVLMHAGLYLVGLFGLWTGNSFLGERIRIQVELKKQLVDSEKRLRSILAHSLYPIFVKDLDGRYQLANPAFEKVAGMHEQDIIGKTDFDLFEGDLASRMRANEQLALAKNRPYEFEEHIKTVDHEYDFISTCFPLYDSEKQASAICGIAIDVTERKKLDHEIASIKNYLQNIVDSMPSVLVSVDADGYVTNWNMQAEKETGIKAKEAMGKHLKDVYPMFVNQLEKIKESVQQRIPFKEENLESFKKGKKVFSDISIYPLIANGVNGAVLRVDDTTERNRIREVMVQTEKMMSIGGLAAGIAHEINNPLSAILQGTQTIVMRFSPELDKNIKIAEKTGLDLKALSGYMEQRGITKFFEAVHDSAVRASEIVLDMLNFSRPSYSSKKTVDLLELIENTVKLAARDYSLKKNYDFRHIKINMEHQDNIPVVSCIPSEIQQVLLNLFNNAAQSIHQSKDPEPEISIHTWKKENCVVIDVTDNGEGMDEETRKRIFEPFFTTKGEGIGTGLGLSVSYFIVTQNHKGQMTVESTPGKGSRFSVSLPV